jgi:ABC-type transport system involved in cytochrome c biogenesis permease subunit
VALLLLAGNVLVMLLGLFIAAQAFRGYRRTESSMMLAIGVGFVFLSLGGVMGCSMFELLGVAVPGQEYLKTCLVGTGMAVISVALYR